MPTDRIVALIDMDCFYVQVEQREEPDSWGTPCAVVQYTGGGVIAVNYEARECGIRRGARVAECKAKCPGIKLFWVPEQRGKADLTKYRNGSNEVFNILLSFDPKLIVERASIDEAYLDLTDMIDDSYSSFDTVDISGVSVAGTKSSLQEMYEDLMREDERLVIASKIIHKIRQDIKEKTQFSCSAGVSFNKVLAKLCAGFKKPNGQSVLPPSTVNEVFATTPIGKVRGLGGKLGQEIMQQFGIETMLQLQNLPKDQLDAALGSKTANWVYEVAKGNDDEPVTSRSVNRSVGCGKNFNGLLKAEEVKHWFKQLTGELVERLTQDRELNDRTATNLTISVRLSGGESFSKTLPLNEYRENSVINELEKGVMSRISKNGIDLCHPIISLSIVAGKFVEGKSSSAVDKTPRISSFLQSNESTESSTFTSRFPDLPSSSHLSVSSSASPTQSQVVVDLESVNENDSTELLSQRGFFYRKTLHMIQSGRLNV